MKIALFALLFMLLTGTAYSADESQEICYTDLHQCFIVFYDKDTLRTSNIYYLDYQQPSGFGLTGALKDIGIDVLPANQFLFANLSFQVVKSTVTTFAEQKQTLQQTDPKVIVNWRQGGRCAGGAALCAGTTFQTIATGGLTFLLAEIGCGVAVLECLDMIDNLNAWSTAQRELERERLSKDTSNGGGGSAQSSGSEPTEPAISGAGSASGRFQMPSPRPRRGRVYVEVEPGVWE